MTNDLKRYTEEDRKFAEEVFEMIHNSFEESRREDEEIEKRWAKYYYV